MQTSVDLVRGLLIKAPEAAKVETLVTSMSTLTRVVCKPLPSEHHNQLSRSGSVLSSATEVRIHKHPQQILPKRSNFGVAAVLKSLLLGKTVIKPTIPFMPVSFRSHFRSNRTYFGAWCSASNKRHKRGTTSRQM